MTPFFVLINGFDARVRPQVRVQSLPRASEQLGNDTILAPAALIIISASCVADGDVTERYRSCFALVNMVLYLVNMVESVGSPCQYGLVLVNMVWSAGASGITGVIVIFAIS